MMAVMGQRMFVAVVPPQQVVEELRDFLEPRTGLPWIAPEQWHLTLAFMESVPEHRVDELAEELEAHLSLHPRFTMRLGGAGAFPNPARASVLWLGPQEGSQAGERLAALARTSRNVANACGASPDGKRFVPHLSLAKLRRPIEATQWLRVLDTFTSSEWHVDEVELVASHLGERRGHRPRHETVATIRLAHPSERPR